MKKWLIIWALGFFLSKLFSSDMAKNLIAQFEGLSLVPYQDSAGIWTIGYGHKILSNEPYYPFGTIRNITQAQADKLLEQDAAKSQAKVESFVHVPLTKNQRDALTSFVFNTSMDNDAFKNSTLLRKLNAGDYQGAADEFAKWIYAGGKRLNGLIARRTQEARLFLS